MKTLVTIIFILLLIILLLVFLVGAMYAAIVAYHETRWRKIKGESYDQYNQDQDV